MIDFPTSKDMASPHHRKAIGALVASGIILIVILSAYFLRPEQRQDSQSGMTIAEKQAVLETQTNPPSGLSATEVKARQALLSKTKNPPSKLTADEIQRRQELMNIE
jgi:hypothetical protein